MAPGGRGCEQPQGTEHERVEGVAAAEPRADSQESTPGKGTAEKGKGPCRVSNIAGARKKVRTPLATKRGELIVREDREKALAVLKEGREFGLAMKAVADLLGICGRSLRRWCMEFSGQGFSVDRRKGASRKVAHKFSAKERQRVINTVNDPRFADLPPGQIVAILAEEEEDVASEMTIYRIMREEGLLNHRGRTCSPREPREVPMLKATAIHQVLAWDITLVPGPIKGQYYYLYMVMDVWSGRILGAEVHERECSQLARDFFDRVCRDEGIEPMTSTVLHSDNGAPMRSYKLSAKMRELGISLSFSRPRVSNDNAYAESLFRTMKYHQSYPSRQG